MKILGIEKAFGEPTSRKRSKKQVAPAAQQEKAAAKEYTNYKQWKKAAEAQGCKVAGPEGYGRSGGMHPSDLNSTVFAYEQVSGKPLEDSSIVGIWFEHEDGFSGYLFKTPSEFLDWQHREQSKVTAAVANSPVAMAIQIPVTFTLGEGCAQLTEIAGVNCHTHPLGLVGVAVMFADNREALVEGMRRLIKADIAVAPSDNTLSVMLANAPDTIPDSILEACLSMTEKVAHLGCSAHLIQGYDHPLGGKLIAVLMDSGLGDDRLKAAATLISANLDDDDLVPNWVSGRVSSLVYKRD